jgi:hypothetical protein
MVINRYFGTNFPLLPDRTFAPISDVWPYALIDITDKVAPRAPATLVAATVP